MGSSNRYPVCKYFFQKQQPLPVAVATREPKVVLSIPLAGPLRASVGRLPEAGSSSRSAQSCRMMGLRKQPARGSNAEKAQEQMGWKRQPKA